MYDQTSTAEFPSCLSIDFVIENAHRFTMITALYWLCRLT